MSDNRTLFIEEAITGAVKRLLTGRVNKKLNDYNLFFPLVEFSNYSGNNVITPLITLSTCERTEKERIILLDVYSLTITFLIPENPDSELYCYAYATALDKALGEDVTLGGVVDKVVIAAKKYVPPKKPDCGQGWELLITLRVTVEGMNV
jgi:general stress protein CsbA